jgi:hypothetical protein
LGQFMGKKQNSLSFKNFLSFLFHFSYVFLLFLSTDLTYLWALFPTKIHEDHL